MLHSAKEPQVKHRRARSGARITKRVRSYKDIVNALPEETKSMLTFDKSVHAKCYAVTKWIMRFGMATLTRHEFLFVNFLTARTVTFGKRAEMITKSQFLQGVWQNETMVCAPLRMAERDLYKTIKSLEQKGILVVTPVSVNGQHLPTIYEFAIDFITTLRPTEGTMSKLRATREKKTAEIIDFNAAFQAKRDELVGVKRHHGEPSWLVSPDTTNIIKVKTEDNELVGSLSLTNESKLRVRRKPRTSTDTPTEENALDCNAKIRMAIDVAASRSTTKRDSKVQHAARGAGIALSDLNAAWKQAMIAAYGSCTVVGLTHKEYGMFKRIAKTHTLDCSWATFFEWTIANWARINKESRDLNAYKAKKSGEWSLKEESTVFLGSDAPDLFTAIKNLSKLVKRYSQQGLVRKGVATEDTEEVKELKRRLAIAESGAQLKEALLQKVLKTQAKDAAPKPATRPVRVVNPHTDSFFKDDNDTLPGWK